MKQTLSYAGHCALVAVVCGLVLAGLSTNAIAADHTDPPDRVAAGDAEDIGDLYAWAENDTLSVVLTFAGPVAPAAEQAGTWDRDVLYGIHIDNDADGTADHDIYVRFGQNGDGEWGMQVVNFPGADAPLVGAVESPNMGSGGMFWAGIAEDPFFFDLNGFSATFANVSDGDDETDLAFTGDDFFAGLNVTAIVLDIPLAAALGGNTSASIWATTALAGG